MFDIVALGELLIDFTPNGISDKGNKIFECNPGGAPGNVLAAASKLDMKTAFIGKVGEDEFGNTLISTLKNIGIDTNAIISTKEFMTTLAIVHLKENGDRSFSFYRNPSADMMLREDEVDFSLIANTKVFHFGSISLTHEPVRFATIAACEYAKENKKIISYDPNFRPLLWSDHKKAKETLIDAMKYCDILKISDEELKFLFGTEDYEEGAELIFQKFNTKLILITLGENGCYYKKGSITGSLRAYKVNCIDSTGAGDSFLGGVIHKILKTNKSIEDISKEELDEAVDFANALSGLVTTKYGGIMSMPSYEQIENCRNTFEKNIK